MRRPGRVGEGRGDGRRSAGGGASRCREATRVALTDERQPAGVRARCVSPGLSCEGDTCRVVPPKLVLSALVKLLMEWYGSWASVGRSSLFLRLPPGTDGGREVEGRSAGDLLKRDPRGRLSMEASSPSLLQGRRPRDESKRGCFPPPVLIGWHSEPSRRLEADGSHVTLQGVRAPPPLSQSPKRRPLGLCR